jgi:hypothetical protein
VSNCVAIASGIPYKQVYDRLAEGNGTQRASKRQKRSKAGKVRTARAGINTKRKWFKDYMCEIGFVWTPCMSIGTGCLVHLVDGGLPDGHLVVMLSRHATAVIDGVINDIYDPSRVAYDDDGGTRAYGGQRGVSRCTIALPLFRCSDDIYRVGAPTDSKEHGHGYMG